MRIQALVVACVMLAAARSPQHEGLSARETLTSRSRSPRWSRHVRRRIELHRGPPEVEVRIEKRAMEQALIDEIKVDASEKNGRRDGQR